MGQTDLSDSQLTWLRSSLILGQLQSSDSSLSDLKDLSSSFFRLMIGV